MGHEQELENHYKRFAQPQNLSKQQCLVLAITMSNSVASGGSLMGRLATLPQRRVTISPREPEKALPALREALAGLVQQCRAKQLLKDEEDVFGVE
jgi:hypothetical protein